MDEQRSSTGRPYGALVADERVVFTTGLHWITAALFFVCPTLLGLGRALVQSAFCVPWAEIRTTVFIFTGVGLVMAAGRTGMILYIRYTVTEDRIIFKDIGFDRNPGEIWETREILLSQVERVDLIQDSFGFMFGYGHLRILLTTGDLQYFYWVSQPAEFREHVLSALEASRQAA